MELPAVVVLLLLALLLGAAFGAWCAWPPPPPPLSLPPEPPPAPVSVLLAPPVAPRPPPGRFGPQAQALAEALHEGSPPTPEALAFVLAAVAADGWSLGVSEMRQALIEYSGMRPATSEHLAQLAILALEARHAGGTARPR